MEKREALRVLKERYLVNQNLIKEPQSDFDRFVKEENEALLVAIEELRKGVREDAE